MSTPADRNLLVGLLALQMDFVTRDGLIAGMVAWTARKDSPLEDVLADQGLLSGSRRTLLAAMAAEHLDAHGGDPQRSLAALSAIGSAREALAEIADPDIQASLPLVSAARPDDDDPYRTSTYSSPPDGSSRPRFSILRPHREGGLGKVSVALDRELNRKVAFKEIKTDTADDDPASRARFVVEAEITGQLEHPGIVPIYSLGHDPTGRPFYAMRFVEGDNLQAAIERFHDPARGPTEPGERTRAFQGLLRRFLDVCNAIAFAHRRGVLHRDIKPGNILLGEYGETLVVDWGLAKVLGTTATDTTPDTEPVRPSGDGSYHTQPGSALGTPGFMSPEQVQGRLDLLGPPSDVYSLGATLYSLLTGHLPFPDRDPGERLQKTLRGDFSPPRAVADEVPKPLEAVCLKAMALRPEDRYPTPKELARDIEQWLADEPVSAWREPRAVRLRRWMKRHRTLVTTSAATLVVAVAGLTLGLLLLDQARRREAKLNDDLKSANTQLNRANTDLGQSNNRLTTALKDVERANATANQRLDQTMEAIRDYYTGISEDVLLGSPEFHDLREKLLAKPLAFYETMARDLESAPADDLRSRSLLATGRVNLSRILWLMGRHEDSKRQSSAAITAFEALVAAQPGVPDYQGGLAASHNALSHALIAMGDLPGAIEEQRRAIKQFEVLTAAHPGMPEYLVRLAGSHCSLGAALKAVDDLPGAAKAYLAAMEGCEILIAARPEVPEYHYVLASTLRDLGHLMRVAGELTEAIVTCRLAVEQYEALIAMRPGVPEYQDGLAKSLGTLGAALADTGDLPGATDAFCDAIEQGVALIAAQPGVPGYQDQLAMSFYNLGSFLWREMGHAEDAVVAFREAIEHHRVALKAAPQEIEIRGRLKKGYDTLGKVLWTLGRIQEADEAAAEWRKIEAPPDGPPPDTAQSARPPDDAFPADPFAR